jgi:hypothetical protein
MIRSRSRYIGRKRKQVYFLGLFIFNRGDNLEKSISEAVKICSMHTVSIYDLTLANTFIMVEYYERNAWRSDIFLLSSAPGILLESLTGTEPICICFPPAWS